MLSLIIHGVNGRMGRTLNEEIQKRNDCKVVAGIDRTSAYDLPFPVFNSTCKIDVPADVIIDFSNPNLLIPLLDFATEKKIPLVICTTGFSENQIEEIEKASHVVPIFFSMNTSIGVNLLIELAKKAAIVLGDKFDIEIVEKHHNKKIDAPSGTAIMIAKAISSVKSQDVKYVYDRHNKVEVRSNNEIGIHCIRAGSFTGEHEVIFAGNNESITISHCAQSKKIFAIGAINAAIFLKNQNAGLYSMENLLK